MTRCSLYYERSYLCTLLPRPFLCPKKLVLRSTRNYALSWKVPERSSIFGADLDLCPTAEFSNSQFGLFRPPPTRHCLPNSWNVREIPRIIACQIGPFASARGAPEALTRWPCATQPGLPPLRAQFQSGILIEWSFALVLGLGEFLRVSLRVFYQ